MPPSKERLDKLLTDRQLCDSRAQAQALIMSGQVSVKGVPITKAGTLVWTEEPDITVANRLAYVSRGGLKLEKALQSFQISVKERHCLDIGASTGGFTDCLLQNGATFVAAIDVGYGQLDWKLRNDPRVQVLEKSNIRHVQPSQLHSATPSLGVVDTSFISLKKVLPPLAHLLVPTEHFPAEIVALLKPQFEHRDYLEDRNFKGIVRGQAQHTAILSGVLQDLHTLLSGWHLLHLDFSPITGPKGNIEYLLHYAQGTLPPNKQAIEPTHFASTIENIILQSYKNHPNA